MPVLNLTPAFMATGLVCPADKKRIEYCDAEVPGLLIECRSSANAIPTWYLRYKADGKTAYTRLGNVQELTLAQARKQAITLKAEHMLSSKRPAPAVEPRSSMVLSTFFSEHYMPHAFLHKRSAKKDEQLFRIHIGPRFGALPLDKISRREVAIFHNDLRAKGQSAASADHSLKLLRRALNLAVQWEYLERNPLVGMALFNEANGVENYLDDAAIQRLVAVLRVDKNRTVSLILLFLLSCGARKTSALQAKWCEIDMDNRV